MCKAFYTLTRNNSDNAEITKNLGVQATRDKLFSHLQKTFAYNGVYLKEPDSCLV